MKKQKTQSIRAVIAILLCLILLTAGLADANASLSASSAPGESSGAPQAAASQTNTSVRSNPVFDLPANGPKTVGGFLTNTFSTSVTNLGADERQTSNELQLLTWKQINKLLRADLFVSASQSLHGERRLLLQNTMLGLMHTPVPVLGDVLSYRLKVTVILPTNENDRELASLRGAVVLGNRFFINIKALPALSSFYQLNLSKSFHGYETTASGESNNQFSVGHTLLTNFDIGKFYVQVVPRVSSRWTYEGTPSSSFELAEEVGVNLGRFSLGVGHTNSDNLVKANGRDSNFSVFDRDTSTYYMTANLSF